MILLAESRTSFKRGINFDMDFILVTLIVVPDCVHTMSEIPLSTQKMRSAFSDLGYLRRSFGFYLPIRRRIIVAAVESVFLLRVGER